MIHKTIAIWVAGAAVGLTAAVRADQPVTSTTQPAESTETIRIEAPPETEAPEADTATQPAAPAAPKPGPNYMALRSEDDFSYLDGDPESYQADLFDPIKYIPIGDDWRLTIGGEIKGRFEYERNKQLLLPPVNSDGYFLHHYHVHASLRYRKLMRAYVEGFSAFSEDVDLSSASPFLVNRWDLYQGFIDFNVLGENVPLTLRVGRQELMYGKQRLISPLFWGNAKRRFDGIKLFWKDKNWDIDAFWARVIVPRPIEGFDKRFDRPEEQQDFFGLYSTYKGIKDHGLDLYFLTLLDHRPGLNVNGRGKVGGRAPAGGIDRGAMQLYTVGMRFWGKTGPWDYETENAIQAGAWNGDQIAAWMTANEVGYNFPQVAMTPRVWIGFDYASGDEDPFDRDVGTFNQLFPLGHAHLGYIDVVGRQNIIDPRFGASLKPHKDLTLRVEQHFFFLAEREDALYNAGGAPTRRDRAGQSGRYVGHETDLTATWKLDRHTTFEVGYSLFTPGGWIDATGPNEQVNFLYAQYQINF